MSLIVVILVTFGTYNLLRGDENLAIATAVISVGFLIGLLLVSMPIVFALGGVSPPESHR